MVGGVSVSVGEACVQVGRARQVKEECDRVLFFIFRLFILYFLYSFTLYIYIYV